jgi:hypothetical protein
VVLLSHLKLTVHTYTCAHTTLTDHITQVAEADETELDAEQDQQDQLQHSAIRHLCNRSVGRALRAIVAGSPLKFRRKCELPCMLATAAQWLSVVFCSSSAASSCYAMAAAAAPCCNGAAVTCLTSCRVTFVLLPLNHCYCYCCYYHCQY